MWSLEDKPVLILWYKDQGKLPIYRWQIYSLKVSGTRAPQILEFCYPRERRAICGGLFDNTTNIPFHHSLYKQKTWNLSNILHYKILEILNLAQKHHDILGKRWECRMFLFWTNCHFLSLQLLYENSSLNSANFTDIYPSKKIFKKKKDILHKWHLCQISKN